MGKIFLQSAHKLFQFTHNLPMLPVEGSQWRHWLYSLPAQLSSAWSPAPAEVYLCPWTLPADVYSLLPLQATEHSC